MAPCAGLVPSSHQRWNILSGIVELLLLRLIYSSCEDLQKPKVILEAKQQKKQGIAMAFSSTWQVIKDENVLHGLS